MKVINLLSYLKAYLEFFRPVHVLGGRLWGIWGRGIRFAIGKNTPSVGLAWEVNNLKKSTSKILWRHFYQETIWKSENKATCVIMFKEIEGFSELAP